MTCNLVSVSADDVRDVINLTSEEVPDDKISKMIKRTEVTLELETDKQVDNSNYSNAEKENINKLQQMTKTEVNKVRMPLKDITGIYRKRIAGTKQPFPKKEEYETIIDTADTNKLAKMLRILSFLTQTKVYLFWKRKTKK